MNKLSERSVAAFRARLLAWYARHKRAMPWRGTRDAYRVWVSEVMLQQTRVAAVEPYYQRFVRRFPTVRALARARSDEVLKLWAGLGYYSRARNLHRAAKEIVSKHGGKFPREVEAALALPGVGRYTAAAVLSIAYGEPLAVVDGNVARVLARLEAVRGDLKEAGRWRKLEERAQELMPEQKRTDAGLKAASTNAGEWNQAMMELGATVCTPRAPRCEVCPVARWCRARKLGLVEKIPAVRTKRETERVEIAAAVLVDVRGRTLLVKPEKAEKNGLFSGMWQFPAVEVRENAGVELRRHLREMRVARVLVELKTVKHSVTHREITLRPYVMRVRELPRVDGARVVRLEELYEQEGGSKDPPLHKRYIPAISSATRKIARAAILDSVKKARRIGAARR